MRVVSAFVVGWASGIFATIIPFLLWDRQYRYWWDPDRPGAEAVAHASTLVSLAAFTAALAIVIAFVRTKRIRIPWPANLFTLGILAGACLGILVDGWCIHVILLDHRQPPPPTPGFLFFTVLAAVILAVIFGLLFLTRRGEFDLLQLGGFSQEDLERLRADGKLSDQEYE